MIPLAAACLHAGHYVLVATGPDMVARVEELGLRVMAVGPSRAEGTDLVRRGSSGELEDAATRRTWDSYTFVHRLPAAAARATDLIPLVQEWRADVLVVCRLNE